MVYTEDTTAALPHAMQPQKQRAIGKTQQRRTTPTTMPTYIPTRLFTAPSNSSLDAETPQSSVVLAPWSTKVCVQTPLMQAAIVFGSKSDSGSLHEV